MDETYEIIIDMQCPCCAEDISFNVQPVIGSYHKIKCKECNREIKITARLKE